MVESHATSVVVSCQNVTCSLKLSLTVTGGCCVDYACGANERRNRLLAPPDFMPDTAIACTACGETGHDVDNCKSARAKEWGNWSCAHCATNAHEFQKCPFKWKMISQATGRKHCHNCGSMIHHSNQCTEEKKVVCLNRGEEGHDRKGCSVGLTCH